MSNIRIKNEIKRFLSENPGSEANYDNEKLQVLGKYNNIVFSIHINTKYPFEPPRIFLNDNVFIITDWSPQILIFPTIIKKINKIQNQFDNIYREIERFLHENPGSISILDTEKLQILGQFNNIPFIIHLGIDYPEKMPVFFINNFELFIVQQSLSEYMIFNIIIEKINKIQTQPIIVALTNNLYISESDERSFKPRDLHDNGHLYNCNDFNSKKFQFGSGFIYSILKYSKDVINIIIPETSIHEYVNQLLECPLIKELGCVYLVLKIYEEHLILLLENYIDQIYPNFSSLEIQQQFKIRIDSFKKKYDNIFSMTNRIDHLNMIITCYVNIWLYHIIQNGTVTYELDQMIEQFIHTSSSTDLYNISTSFINLGDLSIQNFNSKLFLDNYTFVEDLLRDTSKIVNKYIIDFLEILKDFNIQYNTNINSLCSQFNNILGHPISHIISGSICDNFKN